VIPLLGGPSLVVLAYTMNVDDKGAFVILDYQQLQKRTYDKGPMQEREKS